MTLAKFLRHFEDIGGPGAGGQTADIRRLDRGAVGHRIGERHAEFNNIGPAFDEGVKDGAGIGRGRVASGDEGD